MTPRFIVSICIAFLTISSANAQWHEWKSEYFRDHPLVGKVYVPRKDGALDASVAGQSQLLKAMSEQAIRSQFLLLGENHNNPDHHILQAKMLETVVKADRKPDMVFEMIPRSLSAEANSYNLKNDPELEGFAKRLAWEKRGWYSWDIYKPIGLVVAQNQLRVVAGNFDRKLVRSLYKSKTALSEEEHKRFALNESFPPHLQVSLNQELIASHCGMIGETALPAMTRIQRAKDGLMADAMISSSLNSGTVLIAGNGHIRKDRGVPWVLRKKLSDTSGLINTYSIGLIEVRKNITDPKQYELINSKGEALYDVVIFTPKTNIDDPCAAMRKQFKTKKKSSND